MTLTTESGLLRPKRKEPEPTKDITKPVLPEEPPARLRVVQKYKKGPDGRVVPEDYVYITYNQIGQGRGGRFKVPRTWLVAAWKSLRQ